MSGTLDDDPLIIPVTGMTCTACQARVERALAKTPGVAGAEVSFASGVARVTLGDGGDLEAALAAIARAGYEPAATAAQIRARRTAGAAAKKAEEERRSMVTRALVAIAIASLQMLVAMPLMGHGHGMAPALAAPSVHPYLNWALLASTTVVLVLARSFFTRAWAAVRQRTADMNTLVALGAGTAFAYSAVATVAPSLLSTDGRRPDVHFEAASFILAFVMLGRALESGARARTTAAQGALLALVPATATVLRDGKEETVSADAVKADDVFLLRPGARAPADGVVTSGESWLDEALLTGESARVPKRAGDVVHAGTLASGGALQVRATHTGKDTRIARIAALTESAQASRAPVQRMVDRVAAVFAPAIVVVAALAAAAWALFGPEPRLVHALTTFVTVVVVSCPCALGLATPTAIATAVGRAAQLGVLIRSADALERAAHVDTVALDKTGTLTEGEPELVSFTVVGEGDGDGDETEDDLLRAAAAVEVSSEHPVGDAIVRAAEEKGLDVPEATAFVAEAGAGARAVVLGREVLVGSVAWLASEGVAMKEAPPPEAAFGVAYRAAPGQGTLRAWGVVADRIRDDAKGAVARLAGLGVDVVMLTGDRQEVADGVAARVGVGRVHAGLSPEDKQARVARLAEQGRKVAMCGDGVNGAPALAAAHVGVSLAGGTDAAMEASDVTLLSGGLGRLPDALELSRATMRVIKQNLAWAFVYNVVLVPVAAGALVPLLGVRMPPALASAAMALSSVSVVLSSLRLRRFQPGAVAAGAAVAAEKR